MVIVPLFLCHCPTKVLIPIMTFKSQVREASFFCDRKLVVGIQSVVVLRDMP